MNTTDILHWDPIDKSDNIDSLIKKINENFSNFASHHGGAPGVDGQDGENALQTFTINPVHIVDIDIMDKKGLNPNLNYETAESFKTNGFDSNGKMIDTIISKNILNYIINTKKERIEDNHVIFWKYFILSTKKSENDYDLYLVHFNAGQKGEKGDDLTSENRDLFPNLDDKICLGTYTDETGVQHNINGLFLGQQDELKEIIENTYTDLINPSLLFQDTVSNRRGKDGIVFFGEDNKPLASILFTSKDEDSRLSISDGTYVDTESEDGNKIKSNNSISLFEDRMDIESKKDINIITPSLNIKDYVGDKENKLKISDNIYIDSDLIKSIILAKDSEKILQINEKLSQIKSDKISLDANELLLSSFGEGGKISLNYNENIYINNSKSEPILYIDKYGNVTFNEESRLDGIKIINTGSVNTESITYINGDSPDNKSNLLNMNDANGVSLNNNLELKDDKSLFINGWDKIQSISSKDENDNINKAESLKQFLDGNYVINNRGFNPFIENVSDSIKESDTDEEHADYPKSYYDEQAKKTLREQIGAVGIDAEHPYYDSTPIGTIIMYYSTTGVKIPSRNTLDEPILIEDDSYELCDGRTIHQVEESRNCVNQGRYENLKKILGGDNLPDLRGKFIVGYDSTDGDYNKIGNTGGEKSVKLDITNIPPHTHQYDKNRASSGDIKNGGSDNGKGVIGSTYSTGGDKNGNTVPHENRPPYTVVAYYIKAYNEKYTQTATNENEKRDYITIYFYMSTLTPTDVTFKYEEIGNNSNSGLIKDIKSIKIYRNKSYRFYATAPSGASIIYSWDIMKLVGNQARVDYTLSTYSSITYDGAYWIDNISNGSDRIVLGINAVKNNPRSAGGGVRV